MGSLFFFAYITYHIIDIKRRNIVMILFTLLMIALVVFAVITIITILIGGVGFIVIFGDLIICILLIAWIIKHFLKKKN